MVGPVTSGLQGPLSRAQVMDTFSYSDCTAETSEQESRLCGKKYNDG